MNKNWLILDRGYRDCVYLGFEYIEWGFRDMGVISIMRDKNREQTERERERERERIKQQADKE